MSEKRWIKDEPGLYVRIPSRGAFKGKEIYCGRVWVRSLGQFKHFTLGSTLRKARERLMAVKLDLEAALARRER